MIDPHEHPHPTERAHPAGRELPAYGTGHELQHAAHHAAVVLSEVTAGYDERAALTDITVAVATGTLLAVFGPNGGGKSTFLKVIAGLLKPDAGSLKVDGVVVGDLRGRVGYMMQKDLLFPWRTVLANVMLPLQIQGRTPEVCRQVAMEQLARVGLAGFERKYLDMLRAGGTKRHKELLAPFGLDASDPAFWRRGLDIISGFIDELETA